MGQVLPLLGLRAFTEVGRHGSVKAAADAMGVTPGAVSQQVRQLEERVGVQLFERGHRGLHLSKDGARVHAGLARAFDEIEASLETLDAMTARQSLTVNTVPSFAASWLVPRLGRFHARHPGIEVRVEATPALVDLRRDRVDIALRHGLGNYDGLEARRFLTPVMVPVACPDLLRDGPAITGPEDFLKYPLLQDSDRADWTLWLKAVGVPDDPRAERGPSFGDELMLIRAAAAGQGVALVNDIHAAAEIAAGRLAVALECEWPCDYAYYMVTRPGADTRPAVAAFAQWVLEEAAIPPSPDDGL
ncbi:LysR substrate-binding domain-containing protein [Eilatimonas milleporae]|uniref:LysR family glycine cleavage system transcriptional activator n=1 Tax=Eilatimonas milleporae TaxID=911205 RepID=A0A3M0C0F2_9PROT|nr:LysR substrate-binding domain-containing protein [Eilatimonas milleporae]RMB00679.1 LysR family glycine cleavage system transcriptional activator [Eilatimonas milleporae]